MNCPESVEIPNVGQWVLRVPAADDDGERRATPWHLHNEARALPQTDLFAARQVHVLVGPRLVDPPSSCSAAERLSEMREPDVEIARESALSRGRCAVAVDQDAAGTKGPVAATIERQLRRGRADVMQRIACDDGIAG